MAASHQMVPVDHDGVPALDYVPWTMRPAILFPLFAKTRTLSGIGPKLQGLIARVAGTRLVDLIFDLPTGLVDRSYRPKVAEAEIGRIATLTLNVLEHVPSRAKACPIAFAVPTTRR